MIKIIQGYAADVERQINLLSQSNIAIISKHYDVDSSPYCKVYVEFELKPGSIEEFKISDLELPAVAYIDNYKDICNIVKKADGIYIVVYGKERKIDANTMYRGKMLYVDQY